jgi:hypothetical protein
MCCHREKYGAFQQRRMGKWRLMQPARRPVIANPQGEAIHTGTLDCFTLRVRNDGRDSLNFTQVAREKKIMNKFCLYEIRNVFL